MKKIIALVFAFILISLVAYPQSPSLNQLLSMFECDDKPCFDKMVLKNGFNYQNEDDNEKFTSYVYRSDKIVSVPGDESFQFNNVVKFALYKQGSFKMVSLYTVDKTYIDKFVEDLNSSEYTDDITEYEEVNGKRTEYTSDKYLSRTITIYQLTQDIEGTLYTEYNIEIMEM